MSRAILFLLFPFGCLGGCAALPATTTAQAPLPPGLVAVRLNVWETKTNTAGAPVNRARVLDAAALRAETRRVAADGTFVSYPRVVTKPGRPVEFRSTVDHVPTPATGGGENLKCTPTGAVAKILTTESANGEIQLDMDLTFQAQKGPPLAHRGRYRLKLGDTLLVDLASGKKSAAAIRCFVSVERGPES